MKVLWIVHDVLRPVLPHVKGKPSTGGSWIEPLFYALANQTEITMSALIPVINGKFEAIEVEGVMYYTIPIKKGYNLKQLKKSTISLYLKAIENFKPDIIHVHGTEKNFGLLRRYVTEKIPFVCSIQGIINSYNYFLELSKAGFDIEKYKTLKNRLGKGGIQGLMRKWKKYTAIEKEIFTINQYFIGRTLWDKAQTLAINPCAKYFHGEELLRDPFSHATWDIKKCERYSIFISSGAYSIKGLHVLIEAVNLLKKKYDNIRVYTPLSTGNVKSSFKDRIIGEDYAVFITSLIKKYKLQNNFIFLGRLNAEQMAYRFEKAHVFSLPSFIENSPNSLGEAMMVGTPSVVSFTGGISSIVNNESSALLHPIGDFRTLAFQLDKIFSDDVLALRLSHNAKDVAKKRHDVDIAVKQYVNIYKTIIQKHALEVNA